MKTIKLNHSDKIPEKFTGIVEYPYGTKKWYYDGKLHRENGPAIIWDNGAKYWYICNKLHRVDGPAVEYEDGSVEYWYDNKLTTREAIELLNKIVKLREK
jgi:hypothetical protein